MDKCSLCDGLGEIQCDCEGMEGSDCLYCFGTGWYECPECDEAYLET